MGGQVYYELASMIVATYLFYQLKFIKKIILSIWVDKGWQSFSDEIKQDYFHELLPCCFNKKLQIIFIFYAFQLFFKNG